jgi:hypothetical protein
LEATRLCARRSRHSFSQLDFRTRKTLSQDEVLHNSAILRQSKLLVPATRETGQPFWCDLVIVVTERHNKFSCTVVAHLLLVRPRFENAVDGVNELEY